MPVALNLAKSRLAQFDLVGFLDRKDEFFRLYREMFGVKLRMSQLNSAPDRPSGLSEDHLKALKTLCAPDVELYEYARTLE